MISTHDRIQLLAVACQRPAAESLLGNISADDLTSWVTAELGHADALDTWTPHGPLHRKAIAPKTILHIVSGNTPHAAIQSLLRGLLLGSHNILKLPSSGLPEIDEWVSFLPGELKTLVETHAKLTDTQWSQSDAVIAIGSDDTIAAIQQRILPHQLFIPHGHKVSIGIVYRDFENAAPLAARDASLFNQRGCLSPHVIYIDETAGTAPQFAELLASEMENFAQAHPPSSLSPPLSLSEAGVIRNLRETTRFSAANSTTTQLWHSKGISENSENLTWTVIYQASPILHLSCLNRCIYVKPLPSSLNASILEDQFGPESQHLSTIAIHPFSLTTAGPLATLPAHRICPLGDSQQPSIFWHHDGFAPLASLVKWKDIG